MFTREELEAIARQYAQNLGIDPEAFIASLDFNVVKDPGGIVAAAQAFTPEKFGLQAQKAAPRRRIFSPFDETFRRYAGGLAEIDDFISIVAAAAKAESGLDPRSTGDNGKSVGLFHMHEAGAGSKATGRGTPQDQRFDPDYQAEIMVPKFAHFYVQGRAEGLADEELASYVARMAERPAGFEDPNGKAAANYKRAYFDVTEKPRGGAGGPRPPLPVPPRTPTPGSIEGPGQFTPFGGSQNLLILDENGQPVRDPKNPTKFLTKEVPLELGGLRPFIPGRGPVNYGSNQSVSELLGGASIPEGLTQSEGAYYFPFTQPEFGGQNEAVRNILSLIGIDPKAQNPMTKFLFGQADKAATIGRANSILGGAYPQGDTATPGAFSGEAGLAGTVLNAMKQGEPLGAATSVIDKLLNAYQARRHGNPSDLAQQTYLSELDSSPKNTIDLAAAIQAANGLTDPQSMQPVFQNQYSDYRKALALDPNLSFFEYLYRR